MGKINRVLIAGGTHGNELIGVYAIKKFEQWPQLVHRSTFETITLLGNPRAIAANRRYIDQDLNRSFAAHAQLGSTVYEVQRAEDLRHDFGPAGQRPVDFVIDLHGTTANAGVMLILDHLDGLTLGLAAYVSQVNPEVKVYSSEGSGRSQDSLRSLASHRLGIEVGPVAHGTLNAKLFQKTEAVVHAALDYLDQINHQATAFEPARLTVYQYLDTLDFPRNEGGDIIAMVHPQRQFQDYEPLAPGDPLFLTLAGETIAYAGDSTRYPVFVNEAAYYEKGIAMCLTQKQQFQID
jgi:succinylglutamate desuccinylase